MSASKHQLRSTRAQLACGVVAAPLFIAAFTAIGAKKPGYDWRRHTVSSLAMEPQGWQQRVNFIMAGVLFLAAGVGLRRSLERFPAPPVIPALVATAGIGLVGSGAFVTDPVGELQPAISDEPETVYTVRAGITSTRAGKLHNLSAIPIFAGLPVAALVSAAGAARPGDYRWAAYSAGTSVAMVGLLHD